MDYGKALKIARAIKDIQQAEVAVKADLDPSYVCMLEKGKRKPSLGTIERLSGALGIPTHLFSLLATEKAKNRAPKIPRPLDLICIQLTS
jgi:transcriptional regulator with XRE-family HTH domain